MLNSFTVERGDVINFINQQRILKPMESSLTMVPKSDLPTLLVASVKCSRPGNEGVNAETAGDYRPVEIPAECGSDNFNGDLRRSSSALIHFGAAGAKCTTNRPNYQD